MKEQLFEIVVEQDEDGMFIGSISAVQSCYAAGRTEEEMLENLQDVLYLCLKNNDNLNLH